MFHLNERVLEKLVSGSAPVSDVERIRHHVHECRACARRLEEWRDAYAEVDHAYPELAQADSATTLTAGGMVVVSSDRPKWRPSLPQMNLASLLWIVALLMALAVGYGANRLRSANDGFEAVASARVRPPRPETGNGAGVPMPLATPGESLIRVTPRTPPGPPAAVVTSNPSGDDGPPPPAPAPRASAYRPESSRNTPRSTPAQTLDTRADPPPAVPVSPSFRNVLATEASRRLGGTLRLMRGLEPDHIEVGPAAAVPGAMSGLAVVRVVYRMADGGRVLLDQQLIPADSAGFHSIDDPTLENGQTAFGTAPNGVSVATWVDQEGYRISLVAQAPVDSLKQLLQLVR